MFSCAVLVTVLAAIAEARFGQEQIPIAAIQAVTSGGGPGVAATLAGSAISTLLAAANPCAKLQKADEIVAQLGTGDDSIAAAKGLVAAEQNFNPFNVDIPSICSDPTLPTTAALRGVVPLIDPAVVGSDTENANSNTSIVTAFDATGLSVAQIMAAQGFSNFTAVDLSGNKAAAASGSTSAATSVVASASVASSSAAATTAAAAVASSSTGCGSTTMLTVTVQATSAAAASAASSSTSTSAAATASTAAASGNSTVQASTIAGLDFGLCVPTIKFEAGLDGRKDTEFTFQAIDPLVNKGQEEALNPNIITNRICDQLTNVCNANDAAKTACTAAKAQISALATKDVTTANAWNTALGFDGANTNPDNAPQTGLVGHT